MLRQLVAMGYPARSLGAVTVDPANFGDESERGRPAVARHTVMVDARVRQPEGEFTIVDAGTCRSTRSPA